MEEKKPHKHADLIKAWADGEKIEYWDVHVEKWLYDPNPAWDEEVYYRIAIEETTVLGLSYRPYLIKWSYQGKIYYHTRFYTPDDPTNSQHFYEERNPEKRDNFVQWLSDDFITIELGEIDESPRKT